VPTLPEGPLLAVDPGTKRVGIAASTVLGTIHPVGFLDAEPRDAMLRNLGALARDRDSVGIVVGLPINMDGSEGPAAKAARELGALIAESTGLPVDFSDERLTSHAAGIALGPMELTRKKKKGRTDAVAAALLLESYISERKGPNRNGNH
jgi:putative Holliday junction resolvase